MHVSSTKRKGQEGRRSGAPPPPPTHTHTKTHPRQRKGAEGGGHTPTHTETRPSQHPLEDISFTSLKCAGTPECAQILILYGVGDPEVRGRVDIPCMDSTPRRSRRSPVPLADAGAYPSRVTPQTACRFFLPPAPTASAAAPPRSADKRKIRHVCM